MVTRRRDRVYLRSGTSLAALTFEAANPLLSPLRSHLRKLLAVERDILSVVDFQIIPKANDSNCVRIRLLWYSRGIEALENMAGMENRMLGDVLVKVEVCDEVGGREVGRQSCAQLMW